MLFLLYASVLLLACDVAHGKRGSNLQCMDENNKPVDWYVLYKLPKVAQSSDPVIRKGLAYLYITSNTVEKGWQLSAKDISEQNSIPGNTLAPLYDDKGSAKKMWAMYSDSPPNSTLNGKYGHAKGVIMTDVNQGFWLVHSVPNYPPNPNAGEATKRKDMEDPEKRNSTGAKYGYPASGQNYGQSFLCISLGSDQMDAVGRQLMYNQIVLYRRNIPEVLGEQYPVLRDAVRQVRIRQAPYNNKVTLTSLGSLEFISFAKSDKWQKDLYDDFVAPQLQSDLLAETWLNGRGRLPSDCVGAKVYNIESVVLKAAGVDFTSSRDHSKWAVTVDNKSNRSWVCIGDINRADTQYSRGGGTVCFNMLQVWKNYREAVNGVEPCPKK